MIKEVEKMQKDVIIYTTPTCPFCKMVRKFLDDNSIEYEEKDISIDKDAQGEVIEKADMMVAPVIDIDGEIIIGYDENEMRKELEL